MTHAQALQRDVRGFPGHDCPGVLTEVYRGDDGAEVVVYSCARCRHFLAVEPGGFVRNVYPGPRTMVAELARGFEVRR